MSRKSLRPSAKHFRRAGWLPLTQKAYDEWMDKMNRKILPLARRMPGPGDIRRVEGIELLQPVQEFKDFIETNPEVYTDFIRMFDGMTESVCILYPSAFRIGTGKLKLRFPSAKDIPGDAAHV
jgi:phosphatidylserine decarboxylase